jgi:septal ring factor EnvC (AmiA/AmiB activator)
MTDKDLVGRLSALEAQLKHLAEAVREAAIHRRDVVDRLARVETEITQVRDALRAISEAQREQVRTMLKVATLAFMAGGAIVNITMSVFGL